MKETMYIGSGDVSALLSGKDTKAHISLMQRFVSGEKPYYNAKASPIDALRTGAILEDRYLLVLPEDYYPQFTVESPEMDVFKCSLDFARMEKGNVVDFDELKTCSLDDFLSIQQNGVDFKKPVYKKYYNQVQEQLYCTGLDSANLVFLVVYSYDDEENYDREIHENEYVKFRVKRDESVISLLKERGMLFQQIKDYYR
ncbi:MAG: hypothetical protein LBC19_13670 [Tannerella sp.]|jgi:hypothetical protein|nr:hypothetical protein [Tannerella sp.]